MPTILILIIIVFAFCITIGLIIYNKDNYVFALTDDVNTIFEEEKKKEKEEEEIEFL